MKKNDEIELGIEVFHTPKCEKKAETLDLMPHLKLTQIVNRAFTHRVNRAFTHRVDRAFTHQVNRVFTHQVDRVFTHQVDRVFTLRVNRAFTCPLNGYRQETTMVLRAKRGFITRLFTKAKLFDEKKRRNKGPMKIKVQGNSAFHQLIVKHRIIIVKRLRKTP